MVSSRSSWRSAIFATRTVRRRGVLKLDRRHRRDAEFIGAAPSPLTQLPRQRGIHAAGSSSTPISINSSRSIATQQSAITIDNPQSQSTIRNHNPQSITIDNPQSQNPQSAVRNRQFKRQSSPTYRVQS
jgi:hypothetical protein